MPNFLSRIYFRFKYGIRIYLNILEDEKRSSLFYRLEKHYSRRGENYPSLQTPEYIHDYLRRVEPQIMKIFMSLLKIKNIDNCWALCVLNSGESVWHTHENCKRTCVYYLQNPEGLGTEFDYKGRKFRIDLPTNSLMSFPSDLKHRPPDHIKYPRYTFAINYD